MYLGKWGRTSGRRCRSWRGGKQLLEGEPCEWNRSRLAAGIRENGDEVEAVRRKEVGMMSFRAWSASVMLEDAAGGVSEVVGFVGGGGKSGRGCFG